MNRKETISKVISLIAEAGALIASLEQPEEDTLASLAVEAIGYDASPEDIAADELGCAESVTNIIKQMIPSFPIITGTWTLWDKLKNDSRFTQVLVPEAGDIIISPTGTVRNAPFPGHTGIMKDKKNILANRSSDGTWSQDYTVSTWTKRWSKAGFPIYYFRLNK